MAKYIVLRGKVSIGSKRYVKGDVFEIRVKDAEKFPRSMIRRVEDTPDVEEDNEGEPEAPEEPTEEKIRVTI